MSAGHPEYLKLLDEMRELHVRKSTDYGRGADPLANLRAGGDFGVPAWVGVMIRANDKVHRIKSFLANGRLANESVEDSLKDLAAYALCALVLFREGDGPPPPHPVAITATGEEWKVCEGVSTDGYCADCGIVRPCRVTRATNGSASDYRCYKCGGSHTIVI